MKKKQQSESKNGREQSGRFSRGRPFEQRPEGRKRSIQVMSTRVNFPGRGENISKRSGEKGLRLCDKGKDQLDCNLANEEETVVKQRLDHIGIFQSW